MNSLTLYPMEDMMKANLKVIFNSVYACFNISV
jgi:hypothetical protein